MMVEHDTDTLEALDFELSEPLCDFGTVMTDVCDGVPAFVVGSHPCPACGDLAEGEVLCCRSCWAAAAEAACLRCNTYVTRDEAFRIVRVIV